MPLKGPKDFESSRSPAAGVGLEVSGVNDTATDTVTAIDD